MPISSPSGSQLLASTEDEGSERRWARRKHGGAIALIVHPELPVPIPCVLADASSTGARLRIEITQDNMLGGRVKLPAQFSLQMKADRIQVDCTIVWRRSGELGVRYVSTPRPMQRASRPAF